VSSARHGSGVTATMHKIARYRMLTTSLIRITEFSLKRKCYLNRQPLTHASRDVFTDVGIGILRASIQETTIHWSAVKIVEKNERILLANPENRFSLY
jgi:hypothetical protein